MKKIKFFFTGLFMVALMLSCSKNDKGLIGSHFGDDEMEAIASCSWIGETAWGCGVFYSNGGYVVQPGNFATYTPYSEGATVYKWLVAGKNWMFEATNKNMHAGLVTYAPKKVDDIEVDGWVTVTITLNKGWRFEDVEENVKAVGYESDPVGIHVIPGKFPYKFDVPQELSSFSFDVLLNNFYAVHVNVEWNPCEI